MNDLRLCYVDPRDPWAYFTTQDIKDQWGDDWEDSPYEHNSELPYDPCWHNEARHVAERGSLCTCSACQRDWTPDGQPRWTILKVAFDGDLVQPRDGHLNSPYSVQTINARAIPWLRSPDYRDGEHVQIWAGATLAEFRELVKLAGGTVYLPAAGDLIMTLTGRVNDEYRDQSHNE